MDPEKRFTCRREPSGTWMVWDRHNHAPATLGGCELKGRDEMRARAACDILIRIYGNRLDLRSLRARHGFSA